VFNLHALPEFFLHGRSQLVVRHVQITLRRFQVSVTEEKLNRPQIQPLGQPSASGFVSQNRIAKKLRVQRVMQPYLETVVL
jgi:hypothetical protein